MPHNVVVTLLQNNNFGEFARLFDERNARLSLQPFFISIYRSINENNPFLQDEITLDSNLVLFTKFYIWVVTNNRRDIIETFKQELSAATKHEWTRQKFFMDALDLITLLIQGILFNNRLSTNEILDRLHDIEQHPRLNEFLLRAQMHLDANVNLYLHGLMSKDAGHHYDRDGRPLSSTRADRRALHLHVLLDALDPHAKRRLEPAIERGAKLIRSDTCAAMICGLTLIAMLTAIIFNEDPHEKQTQYNQVVNHFLYGILVLAGICASPVLIPTTAILARVASLGTLEIGRGITEVTARMTMNTMLHQYASQLQQPRASDTPSVLQTDAEDARNDSENPTEYRRLQA